MSIKIIVVDDERNILEDTRKNLSTISGIQVAGAFTSSIEALKFLHKEPVDAVILDIEMPGINGINLAEVLRDLYPDIQIIFATGYDNYAFQAYHLRAIEYLMKPFSREDMVRAMNRVKALIEGSGIYAGQPSIEVRTFGKFDVYVAGQALFFKYSKSKELFAYLVDARGGEISMEKVVTTLWEERVYDSRVKQLYRKTVSIMRSTFKDAGCEDICFYYRQRLAANVKAFSCDYYRFLDGDEDIRKFYTGNYMPEYTWAEETNALLDSLSGR